MYFLHFFGRYLLAFTRKSCCFFTDLQVCVTIQLTFDQWIRLKTLSADFLSNFNISQGGEAKLSQLNLRELREQHGCNKGKKKKHTTNLCIQAWISSRPCGPEAGLWSSLCYFCNRYHMQQSCEQQQPPIVSLHITWALRPTIFVLLTFLTFYIKHATDVFLREVAFLADSPLFLLELRCCSLLISRRKERGSKTSTTTIQRPPFSGFDWLTSLLVLRSTFLLVIELS